MLPGDMMAMMAMMAMGDSDRFNMATVVLFCLANTNNTSTQISVSLGPNPKRLNSKLQFHGYHWAH